jgi:hypothetical protein
MHGSVRVHMVYSVRAKLAVRITARFAGPRRSVSLPGRGSRAFRSAGSSRSTRARRRAGLVRTRGRGGLAGSHPRHLTGTPRRGGPGARGRPSGWKIGRAPWRAALRPDLDAAAGRGVMQEGGSRCSRSGSGSGGAGHVPAVEWCWTCHVLAVPRAGDESDHEPATPARGLCERGAPVADQGRPIGVVPRCRPGQDRGPGQQSADHCGRDHNRAGQVVPAVRRERRRDPHERRTQCVLHRCLVARIKVAGKPRHRSEGWDQRCSCCVYRMNPRARGRGGLDPVGAP